MRYKERVVLFAGKHCFKYARRIISIQRDGIDTAIQSKGELAIPFWFFGQIHSLTSDCRIVYQYVMECVPVHSQSVQVLQSLDCLVAPV